jgi:TOTE conflict system primase-like protein
LQQVGVNQHSPAEAKIALFRSLFREREDVYPRRFESRKTGRAGYSPACANEWVAGICEKPRIKCSECPHQRFLPVTDEVLRWHLSGRDDQGRGFVMGVYPMLLDETCFFPAAGSTASAPEPLSSAPSIARAMDRVCRRLLSLLVLIRLFQLTTRGRALSAAEPKAMVPC